MNYSVPWGGSHARKKGVETRKVKTLTRALTRTLKVGKWSVTRRRGSKDGSVKWRFPWKLVPQTRQRKGKYGMRGEIFLREANLANHLSFFFSPSFELCKSWGPTEAHVTAKTESKIWCQKMQNKWKPQVRSLHFSLWIIRNKETIVSLAA